MLKEFLRKTPVLWTVILATALGLRILYWHLHPVLPRDAVLYCRLLEILHNNGAASLTSFWDTLNRHEAFWIPPLSLYLLRIPMFFGAEANSSGIIVSMLAGVSLVLCTLLIGRELFPDGLWHLWGAAFAAVHPTLVELSAQNLRDGIYLAVSGWLMYFLLRLLKKKSIYGSCTMLLLLWPAAFMIRYEALEIPACFVFYCSAAGKKELRKAMLMVFTGLIVLCLCLSLFSPVLKEYFMHQVPARLLLYCAGQNGGSFARILFQKIPGGLFLPFAVSGGLGLLFLVFNRRTDRRAYCFLCTALFMLIWRVLFQINSSRYVNNMIIPCLMLTVYLIYSLSKSKLFFPQGKWLSLAAGTGLLLAGTGNVLYYNPYADCMLKICTRITAEKGNTQIFANKEQDRLSYLMHREVRSFSADTPAFPEKNKVRYFIIWYHPAEITSPDDCRIRQKIKDEGCTEIFRSFINRTRKSAVTVYAGGLQPQPL